MFATLFPFLAACGDAPKEAPAAPWAACTGLAARETVSESTLTVGELDGDAIVLLSAYHGVTWGHLADDLGGVEILGEAPMVRLYGNDVFAVRADAPDRVAIVTRVHLHTMRDGFDDSTDTPWRLAGASEQTVLYVRNAWVVAGGLYVVYAVRDDDWTWSLGFGTAADDGVVTPLVDALVAGVDYGSVSDVTGGYEPTSDTFVIASRDVDGYPFWRVTRAGAVTEGTLGRAPPYADHWASLGDGRWTVATDGGLLVFDPDDMDAMVTFDEAAWPAPFPQGTAFTRPDGVVVVAAHDDGAFVAQAWDGADPAAGAAATTPFTFDACNPWANMPDMEMAR